MADTRRFSFSRVDNGDTTVMAERLGVHRAQIRRWRLNGLTEQAAERVAHALGLLDIEVWPELLEEAIEEATVKCEADDCPEKFVPPATAWGQKRKRFCSRTCQIRSNHRRRYQENAEARERKKAKVRAYKAEVRTLKARRRAA